MLGFSNLRTIRKLLMNILIPVPSWNTLRRSTTPRSGWHSQVQDTSDLNPLQRYGKTDLGGVEPPESCVSATLAEEGNATPIGQQVLYFFSFCVMPWLWLAKESQSSWFYSLVGASPAAGSPQRSRTFPSGVPRQLGINGFSNWENDCSTQPPNLWQNHLRTIPKHLPVGSWNLASRLWWLLLKAQNQDAAKLVEALCHLAHTGMV